MKSFKFNRKKEDLLPVMKAKAEKANIKMTKREGQDFSNVRNRKVSKR